MHSGIIGTNGKLAWRQEAGRLWLDGETIGKKVILTVQNYSAWRCHVCQLLVIDYSHDV